MNTYIVTIGECILELEAKDHYEAKELGVKTFLKMAKESWNLKLKVTFVRKITTVRLKSKSTKVKDLELISSYNSIPQEDKEWLTGFWEGDGSVAIQGTLPSITFTQKDPQILLYIRKLLKLKDSPREYNKIWELSLGVRKGAYFLLRIISENIVSQSRIDQLNKLAGPEFNLSLTPHKPTYPWLAGFWDAEGSIDSYGVEHGHSLHLSISQKDSSSLRAIQGLIGKSSLHQWKSSGFTKEPHWYLEVYGRRAFLLVPPLLRYSRHKEKKDRLLNSISSLAINTRAGKTYLEELLSNNKPIFVKK